MFMPESNNLQLWGAHLRALEQYLSYYYLITCNNIKHRLSGMCEKPSTTALPSEDERAIGHLQKRIVGNHLLQPHPPLHSNRYRCSW